MEKYIKKLKFIEEHMIFKHILKQDIYDIIVDNRNIRMVEREESNKHGQYGIEVTISPESTMTYYYVKRENRDNDFEEVNKFKEIYNEYMGGSTR